MSAWNRLHEKLQEGLKTRVIRNAVTLIKRQVEHMLKEVRDHGNLALEQVLLALAVNCAALQLG